ncbi:hypothetical protein ACTHOQ_09390 [Solibacillus silvestris]|uniref:hypothetical protein n=1 Tax=Solibacillus silvestris TaxID=76853 RepID=UPI003F7E4401
MNVQANELTAVVADVQEVVGAIAPAVLQVFEVVAAFEAVVKGDMVCEEILAAKKTLFKDMYRVVMDIDSIEVIEELEALRAVLCDVKEVNIGEGVEL